MKRNVTSQQYEQFIQSRKMALNRLNDHMELQKQNKKRRSGGKVDDIAMSNIILDKADTTANNSRYGSSNVTQDTNSSFATQQQHTSPTTQYHQHEEKEEEVPWFKRRDDISNYNNTNRSTSYESSNNSKQSKVSPPPNLVPNRYQNLLKHDANDRHKLYNHDKNNDTELPSSSSSTSTDTKPSGGIFSSISKQSTLNTLKHGSDTATTRIPLNELFPTLYATNNTSSEEESTTTKKKQRQINKKLIYNTNHYDDYRTAIETVLNEHGAQRAIKRLSGKYNKTKDGESNSENKSKEVNERVVKLIKNWLLNDHRIIERSEVKERWNNVTTSDDDAENEEGESESKFINEFKEQQDVFLKKLLESSQEEDTEDDTSSAEDKDTSDTSNQHKLTIEQINPQFFHAVTDNILSALGRYCARRARSSPMIVAWSKIKESGLLLNKDAVSTYLYVVGTMNMGGDSFSGSGLGSIGSMYPLTDNKSRGNDDVDDKEEEDEADRFLVPEEVATYHDLSTKPTESSISLRIKSLVSKGNVTDAQELLDTFKKSISTAAADSDDDDSTLKSISTAAADSDDDDSTSKELIRLRTYIPILKYYCDNGDISHALSVFKQMQSTNGVILEPETYVLLMSAIAENRLFHENALPIEGVQDLGYTYSHGPQLFDELVTEMANDVLEISSSSARRLCNSLAIGIQSEAGNEEDNGVIVSVLKEVHPLKSIPLSRQPASNNEVVASRVSLDRSTGLCEVTNAQQRLIILEPDQRVQLHDDLLNLSTEQSAKFAGTRANDDPNRAREKLEEFSDWLDKREGEPFTAIVDGANIGYYMQSFDKGRFNYHQIKFMVDTLEERGENPLVVIPSKYGYNQFFASNKREHQRLDQSEIGIMNDLNARGKLYKVPPRCLDDFYWMLASVSDQTTSRNGQDLSVSNDDPNHRFPGTRPMLITNDQMRDHRFDLLEPRLFRRWYGCHIVNYNFTAFVLGESVANNEIGFSQADFFSREIQGNPSGINTAGDDIDDGEWEGQAWHFPVNDWDLDERFVIRIPLKKRT